MVDTVIATPEAEALIQRLIAQHGPVMFFLSGGCCEGSAPNCYPRGEFVVGPADILLGQIAASPFYISRSQYEFSKHTQLIIDVVPGRGGMFSLEGPEGYSFHLRSRLFTDEEIAELFP
ncbi:DUF779 domain-containing protein [Azoarcus sp. KH32C]|uniref:DUF779 domain-containing protein n=1 Tax=Azoarcus sp. KH32C TaxID=748247 RepID=UPI0002386EA4|nr:DUF779 domain-containing protein [Azoarcus sp. KH32C]BAL23925.1 hypothetical protein AZKH_1604 [Azoarcus sp. KH32C]